MNPTRAFSVIVAVVVAALGCHAPGRPTPLQLDALTLDGGRLDAASMRGTPQVVALWLPG